MRNKDNATMTKLWVLVKSMSKEQREELWKTVLGKSSPSTQYKILKDPAVTLTIDEATRLVQFLEELFPEKDISISYLCQKAA